MEKDQFDKLWIIADKRIQNMDHDNVIEYATMKMVDDLASMSDQELKDLLNDPRDIFNLQVDQLIKEQ